MDIKKVIKKSNIRQWRIAELIDVSEFTLSRWLRYPERLEKAKRTKIENAIKKLIGKQNSKL